MTQDWDGILTQFEALNMWALQSLKQKAAFQGDPQSMPYSVARAEFIHNNAEGMLDLIPRIENDRRFGDLRIGIEQFVFWLALPERDDMVVQVWSDAPDEYTLALVNTTDLSQQEKQTVDSKSIVETILDYVSLLEE